MSAEPIVVSGLSATPVKGLRIMPRTGLVLDRDGVVDNRRFYLIDERGRMVNGKQLGALNEIVADYQAAERRLTMTFPDGSVVTGEVAREPAIHTSFFSRPAHAEDAWVERRLRVGEAMVAVHGHVGRCLVTSRHPETGEVDLPTLDLLRSYRGDAATTEPLAFGIYGEVLEPGTVQVGDSVELC